MSVILEKIRGQVIIFMKINIYLAFSFSGHVAGGFFRPFTSTPASSSHNLITTG